MSGRFHDDDNNAFTRDSYASSRKNTSLSNYTSQVQREKPLATGHKERISCSTTNLLARPRQSNYLRMRAVTKPTINMKGGSKGTLLRSELDGEY